MRLRNALFPLALLCIFIFPAKSQDSVALDSGLYQIPNKILAGINKKSRSIDRKLEKQTEKYLAKLQKQEKRLNKKLWKKDSTAAKELFGDINNRYTSLKRLTGSVKNAYSPHLDSMQSFVRFVKGSSTLIANNKLQSALDNYNKLRGKLSQADEIRTFLKERQQLLKQKLENFGLLKELKKFQKDAYYYRAQVDEYRKIFEDPSKLESKLLEVANTIPAFRDFFSKHSMLSGIFPSREAVTNFVDLQGLQTRSSVQQLIQQRIAGGGPNASQALQQNIQQAQDQLTQWKDKLRKIGGGSSDADIPDFKPNSQKTKSFLSRLELGSNLQSTKSNYFFPTTTDIGLSVGYKLNDKSIVGIGASYKIGWGKDIRRISLSHEGVGLRSFLDWKIKGSLFASGGFEYNYQQPFISFQQLNGLENWRQSGLLGVSKILSVNSKVFKKTKVQLLWDFLSYNRLPKAQPIKFRLGYNF